MTDLIPLAYLNEACFLSLNTDDKKYRMCLEMSQEDMRIWLGNTFYDQIESQYVANTLDTNNTTLYNEYLKKYLAWQTYFNYLKFANVEATPSGIRVFKDDNSDLASDIQMYSLEKNVRFRADNHKGGAINFIKLKIDENTASFPLWDRTRCHDYGLSFAITAVDKNQRRATVISIDKAIRLNE